MLDKSAIFLCFISVFVFNTHSLTIRIRNKPKLKRTSIRMFTFIFVSLFKLQLNLRNYCCWVSAYMHEQKCIRSLFFWMCAMLCCWVVKVFGARERFYFHSPSWDKKKWVEKEKYESNSINSSSNREIKYYVCGTIFNGFFYHISYICFPHINSRKTKSKTYFEWLCNKTQFIFLH